MPVAGDHARLGSGLHAAIVAVGPPAGHTPGCLSCLAMPNPDLALLRFMRTRGHAPRAERAAKAIAASGEYGAIWAAAGSPRPPSTRPAGGRWLAAAALAPAAIGINFAVKLAVRRRRPQLEGLPPLGGAPTSLSMPSAHATASFAAATAMSRIAPRRASGPLRRGRR